MARIVLAIAFAAAVVLFGCAPGPPLVPEPVAQGCIGVPISVCQDELRAAQSQAPGHGGLVSVSIRCSAPPCTDQGGMAEVVAVFADGTRDEHGVGWAGPIGPDGAPAGPVDPELTPLPIPVACLGVPQPRCNEMAANALSGRAKVHDAVRIAVRCTAPPCTLAKGDGDMVITMADGRQESAGSWGYSSITP